MPCTVSFTFKDEYAKGHKDYTAADFPELPGVRYDTSMYGARGVIEYDRAAHLPVEEAMKLLAENPMIEYVGISALGFLEGGDSASWSWAIPACRGDLNCDQKLNVKDIVLMMQFMLDGSYEALAQYGQGWCCVDVDGDGWVNAKDIIQVMKWILEG